MMCVPQHEYLPPRREKLNMPPAILSVIVNYLRKVKRYRVLDLN